MKLSNSEETMIRSLLHNLHPHSCGGTRKEKANYARGVLVSVVGMIQAFHADMNFHKAIAIASELAPVQCVRGCCPEDWCKQFGMPEDQENENWKIDSMMRTLPE